MEGGLSIARGPHRSMQGHNILRRSGRLYVGCVIAAGTLVLLHSLGQLYVRPADYRWLLLAGLTLVTGSFTVKVPGISSSISVSETFVIIAVLLFGTAPATITVALEGLVISLWLLKNTREVYRVFFNMAAGGISVWTASQVFFFVTDIRPLSQQVMGVGDLLGPIFLLALVYYLANSWLIAFALGFETGTSPLEIWRTKYTWFSLNYLAGASVAALLLPYTQQFGLAALWIIAPLLAISYLTFSTFMGRMGDTNLHLLQLNRLYLSTIETLAMAIDAKDQITHGHVRRVQLYAGGLARALGMKDQGQIKAVEAAALLHDMGKLAVPEYILNKPGQLTPAEFEKRKLHATVGADILASIDFPYPVVPIVRHHHERWDGAGYPAGLKETEIPIGARILSVVDCFDALTSDRPYRPKLSHTEALRILKERSGTMYDAAIVETFSKIYGTLAPTDSELGREGGKPEGFEAITASVQASQTQATTASRLDDISASTDEMLTVYNLARALTGQTNLADAGDVIAKHLRRMLPTSLSVFYVYDEQRDELVAGHPSGEHAELVSGLRIPLGQRLTGWVGANRQTILNSDPVLDLGDMARSLNPRPRSCLSTPLVADKELVGVLSLYPTSRDAFTEDHRRIIEVVARQVSQVVRHAVEFNTVRQTTLNDALIRDFRFAFPEQADATPVSRLQAVFLIADAPAP